MSDLLAHADATPWRDAIALVTGAAGGLGRATTELLLARGARVVAADLDGDGAARVAAELGDDVIAVAADCATSAGIRAALDAAESTWRAPVGLLVNNAGVLTSMALVDHRDEDLERVMRINAVGPMIATREFATRLISAGLPGAVVNVSSSSAFLPVVRGLSAYGASKGAVVTYTRIAAFELARHRIRVNAVAPGWMRTPMSGELGATPAAMEQGRILLDRIPMRTSTDPSNVADTVVYLLSDGAGYVTGVTVPVDGGMLAS